MIKLHRAVGDAPESVIITSIKRATVNISLVPPMTFVFTIQVKIQYFQSLLQYV